MEEFTLAYSPCPNDTYIFAALTERLLPAAPRVSVRLADIEELNVEAARGTYALTKASYGAVPFLMDRYRILRSGGALGRGCGPLVVSRPNRAATLEDLRHGTFAIPGERTTAFMLLQLALGARPNVRQMRFDEILPAVARGDVDAGLIIHESRFTYRLHGLASVADLGQWWETASGMAIPLGAILVRNDVGEMDARALDDAVRASLRFARNDEPAVMPYVRAHASEMDERVMRSHIDLYVNDYSEDVGDDGIAAVRELFARANDAGVIPNGTLARFVEAA